MKNLETYIFKGGVKPALQILKWKFMLEHSLWIMNFQTFIIDALYTMQIFISKTVLIYTTAFQLKHFVWLSMLLEADQIITP